MIARPRSPPRGQKWPKAMAALTSLGVDVEAALDYGALGRFCSKQWGINHHKSIQSNHFGGYYMGNSE